MFISVSAIPRIQYDVCAETYQQAGFFSIVFFAQQAKVTGLRGCVATYVYNFRRRHFQQLIGSFSCMPARGGSVMITSGLPCCAKNSSLRIFITSPAKNSAWLILFNACILFCICYSIFNNFYSDYFLHGDSGKYLYYRYHNTGRTRFHCR